MAIRSVVAKAIRRVVGQNRQVSRSGNLVFIALREDGWRDGTMLKALERRLGIFQEISWAACIADIHRVVVELEPGQAETDWLVREIILWEREQGIQLGRFPDIDRFPGNAPTFLRISLELLADTGSLALGFALGKSNNARLGLWIDLSALVSLTQNMPDLRQPLEKRLGKDNTELLLSAASSLADAMMRGWSGPSLDIAHRLHQYQSFLDRRRAWESHQHNLVHWWRDMPAYEQAPVRRHPLPEGPVEQYQRTAEKFALAGFGAGMASTHNLTKSVGSLFAAVPKPAVLGRNAYISEMIRRLAASDVIVLEHQVLGVLDRVTDVVIDSHYLSVSRYHVASVLGLSAPAPELRKQAQAVLDGQRALFSEGMHWRLEPADEGTWPASVAQWAQYQPINAGNLRLLYCDDRLAGAVVIHETRDASILSLINRIRESGINLSVVGNDPDHFRPLNIRCFSHSEWQTARDRIQSDRGVLLAVGSTAKTLAGADIALGVLVEESIWPQGCHLLTRDWTAALWMLIEGIDKAKLSAHQGVELSRIDIFSGLILSLGAMTPHTISRIKMAANGVSLMAMANSVRLAREVNAMPANLHFDVVPWHAMDVASVVEQLESSFEGLSENQIDTRLTITPKGTAPSKGAHFRGLLWQEIANPLAPVLLAGAGLSALTGAAADAALIGLAVGINTLVGSVQRYRVESRIAMLDQQQQRTVRCLRNGQERDLEIEKLLPGDIIHLQAGDVAPVDARILAETDLEMDESSLTGESLPVRKQVAASYSMLIAEQRCMVFQSTTVAAGEVHAVVVSLPENSEASRGVYVQSAKHGRSGVEARLDSITRMTTPVVAFAGVSLMISGLSRGQPVSEVVGAGVSLAVAAVPEGLPIMATMAQLASSSRLANIGAVVRNPRAVEALGRMNILCADKTGTLTEGTLTLERIATSGGECSIEELDSHSLNVLVRSLLATPEANGTPLVHMTDAAIVDAASRHAPDAVAGSASWARLSQLPFSSDRGYHATLTSRNDDHLIVVKGAPEILLPICLNIMSPAGKPARMSVKARSVLKEQADRLASKGYRVLVVAERHVDDKAQLQESDISALSFWGFVALTDPVRPTAKAAVSQLRDAGVSVRMITGDHPLTASAIAERLGLDNPQHVITGADLDAIPDWQLCQQLKDVNVFARVSPRQKAKIVAALQSDGSVVGMTGDGANDAAAIRMADVGIALGENSTASARAAADLLVSDGRIETIVAAVVEGRSLWSAVRDAVALLIGGNLGEIGFTLLAGLLDGRSPLNARQLLLVNLLTDTIPALAVALRRPDESAHGMILHEGPDASLGDALTRDIEWRAALTTGVATLFWAINRVRGQNPSLSTLSMLVLVGTQLAQTVLAGKGSRDVILSSLAALVVMGVIVQTPGLSHLFGCRPLGPRDWAQVAASMVLSLAASSALPWAEQHASQLIARVRKEIQDLVREDSLEA